MKKISATLLFLKLSLAFTAQTNNTTATHKLIDPLICLVTCNDAGSLNEVVWVSGLIPENDSIIIFRSENNIDFFEKGRRAAKDGIFIDTDTSKSGPRNTSFYYQIQHKDPKGNLSERSPAHRSILTQGNKQGTFSWNAYEIAPKNAAGKVIYTLWRQDEGIVGFTKVGDTEDTHLLDEKFEDYKGKGSLWWVTIDNFNCDGRTRTKGNNSNE